MRTALLFTGSSLCGFVGLVDRASLVFVSLECTLEGLFLAHASLSFFLVELS
jgi:hypothetical protein